MCHTHNQHVMATVDEKEGQTPSIRITQDDRDNAEEVDLNQKPPSTAFTKALEDSVKLKELREEKKQELKSQLVEIRSQCDDWGIKFSELI